MPWKLFNHLKGSVTVIKHPGFVTLIGVFMFFSSCTQPPYTLEELEQANIHSKKEAVEINSYRSAIEPQIDLFISVFSAYNREEIAASIPDLYATDAFLNDRIHSVVGGKAIGAYFDASFDKMHAAKFEILEKIEGVSAAFLHWKMGIQLKEGAPFLEFLGMSELRFDKSGKIIYHQDYWDFSELMGEIRGLRSLVKFVKNRA